MKVIITKHEQVELNPNTVKEVVKEYSQNILGEDCYINKDGHIEHWTSWPHGSGTTTVKEKATDLQLACNIVLESLYSV